MLECERRQADRPLEDRGFRAPSGLTMDDKCEIPR